jgi:uncharacterized protein YeaO (DUF488 family)
LAARQCRRIRNTVNTKRWNDPARPDDGTRILICRYRPRGLRKADETWDEWQTDLAPSRELHAAYYGKHGPPIGWTEYERRYLAEMKQKQAAIEALVERLRGGERITLLCSSACVDPARCHRTLLANLCAQSVRK